MRRFVLRAIVVVLTGVLVLPSGPALAAPAARSAASVQVEARYTSAPDARMLSAAALGHRNRRAVWEYRGTRSWVRWTTPVPALVDRVRIVGSGSDRRLGRSVIRFDDGSRITVRGDRHGDVDARFSARTVRSAVLVASAARRGHGVAIRRLSFTGPVTPSAVTATVDGDAAPALVDARAALPRSTGSSWTASGTGPRTVVLRWTSPVRVATVQVYGAADRGPVLHGTMTFSDGSSVRLLPIPAGQRRPVTVAFTPRVTSTVSIRLTPTGSGPIGLREVAVFGPGERAPILGSSTGPTRAVAASDCSGTRAAASSTLRLLCPSTGTTIAGSATLAVAGPEGAGVVATSLARGGVVREVGRATVRGSTARIRIDASGLPAGPIAVRLASSAVPQAFVVQLVHGTIAASSPPAGREGASLVYDDEFDGGLSVSSTGDDAVYAATKPASWGNSEFGGAVFADPGTYPENLGTVNGGYLRIRTTPLGDGETDPAGWGRRFRGGILASASVNGGFAAQYGYFEARVLAPSAPGTWPAFWMMSDGFLEDSEHADNSEVDAVELYGQDSGYSCHSWHDWQGVSGARGGNIDCVHDLRDWADTWHVYGVDISRTATRYYIDGKLVSTAPAVRNAQDPFYFMLDLSLGGGWPVDLSGTGGVTDMYVDYVRVYV